MDLVNPALLGLVVVRRRRRQHLDHQHRIIDEQLVRPPRRAADENVGIDDARRCRLDRVCTASAHDTACRAAASRSAAQTLSVTSLWPIVPPTISRTSAANQLVPLGLTPFPVEKGVRVDRLLQRCQGHRSLRFNLRSYTTPDRPPSTASSASSPSR